MYKFSKTVEHAVKAIYMNYQKENAQHALEQLKKAADEGDGDAMYLLGRCYAGESLNWKYFEFEENQNLAERYIRKSVLAGSAVGVLGALRLSMLSESLQKKMPFESVRQAWQMVYEQAKEGCPFCQNMVGNAYYWQDMIEIEQEDKGNTLTRSDIKKNVLESIVWYEKALCAGFFLAMRNLIRMYVLGEKGVLEPQPERMPALIRMGVATGHPECLYKAGLFELENGDEKAGVMLCRRAAEAGQTEAWYEVARATYANGKGDVRQALREAEKGVDGLNGEECCGLAGKIYLHGAQGVSKNYRRAVELLERACSKGEDWPYTRLAFCYAQGLGCVQDVERALKLLHELDECDCPYARFTLGYLYAEGLGGVRRNLKKAIRYWQEDSADFEPSQEAMACCKRTWYGKWVMKR